MRFTLIKISGNNEFGVVEFENSDYTIEDILQYHLDEDCSEEVCWEEDFTSEVMYVHDFANSKDAEAAKSLITCAGSENDYDAEKHTRFFTVLCKLSVDED